MQIVWCSGGLGNQMFQYAFYRSLQLGGKNVALDISGFDGYELHNGFELDKVFSIKINLADKMLVNDIKQKISQVNLLKRIWWKIFVNSRLGIEQKDFGYSSKFNNLQGLKYLKGYWQSEKYFDKFAAIIRDDFTFSVLNEINQPIAEYILKANSISIHVRMGDYVNHPLHGGVCTIDYYQRAIDFIKSEVEDPMFFVFSNDVEWCKKNLQLENTIYVTGNDGENSYRDMQLMSMCKHNIIANSSFSWWGAWLNNNSDKIVIAPEKWFNDENINTCDLLPESWMKI